MELNNKQQVHGQPQVPGERSLVGVRLKKIFFLISPIYFLIYFFFNLTDLSARWADTHMGEIFFSI